MPPEAYEPDLDAARDSSSLERLLELSLMADLTQEAWFGRGESPWV